MGILRYNLVLDKQDRTYRNGEDITGRVFLQLDSPMTTYGVRFGVFGKGKIQHDQKKNVSDIDNKNANDCKTETYIDEHVFLTGGQGQRITISTGEHVWPFTFRLPEGIPASFQDVLGHICYKARASIIRPWYIMNTIEEFDITIIVPLDLNRDPDAANAVDHKASKTFMGCPGSLETEILLPVRGYVPGQTMPIIVKLVNTAGVNLKGVYFTMIKKGIYHGCCVKRIDEEALSDHETPLNENTQNDAQIHHFIQIPQLTSSYVQHSNIIDIEYILRIEVRTAGMHKNLETDVPIIIGSEPLLVSTVTLAQNNSTPLN